MPTPIVYLQLFEVMCTHAVVYNTFYKFSNVSCAQKVSPIMSMRTFRGPKIYFDRRKLPYNPLHWTEAKNHIGEVVSIYGEVKSTFFDWKDYEKYLAAYQMGVSAPKPTFIEVGEKYPSKDLVKIVIWGKDWGNFEKAPDILYKNQTIVFTGIPYIYNGIVTVQVPNQSSIIIMDGNADVYRYVYERDVYLFEGYYGLIDDGFVDEEDDENKTEAKHVHDDNDDAGTWDDVIDCYGFDPREWHFDEDNGWLDYYPEE